MFSKMKNSSIDYKESIEKLKLELNSADAIMVGVGAGLSTAAGLTYSGERFYKYFADFSEKYGIRDMYSGGFFPFENPEEYWAWWSRHIWYNRYEPGCCELYQDMYSIFKNTNYFIISTNVDHQIQLAGFDKKRLFYTQGDYGLFQCSKPCSQITYDNKDIVQKMVKLQENMKIPSELIPKCPVCGSPMTMNLRADDKFVQDGGWYAANDRYNDFFNQYKNLHILYLELGVGFNTPGIIKYPFWKATAANSRARYVCINYGEAYSPQEIEKQSICIDADIKKVISDLM